MMADFNSATRDSVFVKKIRPEDMHLRLTHTPKAVRHSAKLLDLSTDSTKLHLGSLKNVEIARTHRGLANARNYVCLAAPKMGPRN